MFPLGKITRAQTARITILSPMILPSAITHQARLNYEEKKRCWKRSRLNVDWMSTVIVSFRQLFLSRCWHSISVLNALSFDGSAILQWLSKQNTWPGADLGIFVCQSKMTSHFCNDRFHFFFRGVRGEDAPPENFLKRSCILRALWSKILKY